MRIEEELKQLIAADRKKQYIKRSARVLSLLGVFFLSLVLAVFSTSFFIHWVSLFATFVALSTLLLEGTTYWRDVPVAADTLLRKGPVSNLRKNAVISFLLRPGLSQNILWKLYKDSLKGFLWERFLNRNDQDLAADGDLRLLFDALYHDPAIRAMIQNLTFQRAKGGQLSEAHIELLVDSLNTNEHQKTLKKVLKRALSNIEAISPGHYEWLVHERVGTGTYMMALKYARTQVRIKILGKILIALWGLSTGLLFGTVSFESIFAIAPRLSLMIPPALVTAIAAIAFTAVALNYGLLMYRMMDKMVDDNLFRGLKQAMADIFVPEERSALNTTQKMVHGFKVLLTFPLFLVVAGLSGGLTLLSAGTVTHNAIQFVTRIAGGSERVNELVLQQMMRYVANMGYVPPAILFAFLSSWGFVGQFSKKATRVFMHPQEHFKAFKVKLREGLRHKENWIKTPFYLMGLGFAMSAMFFHFVGTGAFSGQGIDTANEDANVVTEKISIFVSMVANWLNQQLQTAVTPEQMVVYATILLESMQHLFYLGGQHHGDSFPTALSESACKIIQRIFPCARSSEISTFSKEYVELREIRQTGDFDSIATGDNRQDECCRWLRFWKTDSYQALEKGLLEEDGHGKEEEMLEMEDNDEAKLLRQGGME